MIFSKTVKLSGDSINPATFQPDKTGIDITWKKYHDELYATFSAGNLNSEMNLTEKHDINRQLSKLKVIQDTIKDYKTYNAVRPKGFIRRTLHDDGNRYREDVG